MVLNVDCENGTKISSTIYKTIQHGMFELLEAHGEIPAHSFFRILHEQFADTIGENVGWYIYQVKLDMEAKGQIKSQRDKKKRNAVAVIKMGKKNARAKNELDRKIRLLLMDSQLNKK